MHNNTNRTKPTAFAMFCLLLLSTLVLLAACGSNSSTGSPSTSSTATSNAAPTATSSGYYGRYGSGNNTPTATTAPTGATQTVSITTDSNGQFTFSPKTLTISVGTTVIWNNSTQAPHTVTSNDGKTFNTGDSNPVAPGASFSFKFTTAGTFAYHCDFHPYMVASIIVK